jgi:hypothetical protein
LLLQAGSNTSDYSLYVRNSANNADYLFVRGDGNVGIGTTTPGFALQVGNNISSTAQIYAPGGSNTPGACAYLGSSFGLRESATGNHFNIDMYNRSGSGPSGWNPVITVSNASGEYGNVGIGTTNPARKIDVLVPVGDVATGACRFFAQDPAYTGTVALIDGGWTSGTYGLLNCRYGSSGTSALYVRGDGNVGIGTTSPAYGKLQIDKLSTWSTEGTAGLSITTGTNAQPELEFGTDNGNTLSYIQSLSRATVYTGVPLCVQPNGGTVGIGTSAPSASYALYVNGAAGGTTSWNSTSDRRFKTSITPIDSSLSKVEKLQGVYYDWDRAKWPKKNFPEGKQIGLIAQDVEKVVPEVVNTDKEGYKSLSYDKLTAVLIEAVKEQEKEIASLKKEVEELKATVKK